MPVLFLESGPWPGRGGRRATRGFLGRASAPGSCWLGRGGSRRSCVIGSVLVCLFRFFVPAQRHIGGRVALIVPWSLAYFVATVRVGSNFWTRRFCDTCWCVCETFGALWDGSDFVTPHDRRRRAEDKNVLKSVQNRIARTCDVEDFISTLLRRPRAKISSPALHLAVKSAYPALER